LGEANEKELEILRTTNAHWKNQAAQFNSLAAKEQKLNTILTKDFMACKSNIKVKELEVKQERNKGRKQGAGATLLLLITLIILL